MRSKVTIVAMIILLTASAAVAQQPAANANAAIAQDVSRIAVSVQALSKSLREFVDKMGKAETVSLPDRHQKLILGMQLLVQAEQRLATQQRYNVEIAEKDIAVRSRLAQIEIELNQLDRTYPSNIEGSTQTPEIREVRRNALQAEKTTLQNGQQQLQNALMEAQNSVRESQGLVQRLRRTYLPQVERELAEP
ncbi:MAG TPA: hypothetical protein VL572_00725 [Pyrinomonadaceae bacterium]|nr:hypothetical protein [Pyrinomonadaceae bacterium]